MGCQDSFKVANWTTIVCFYLILFAQMANWIAMTTTSWSFIRLPYDTSGDIHYGLWRSCRSELMTGCTSLDGWADSTYGIVQGFASLGFMCLNIGHLMLLLFMFVNRWKKTVETGTVSGVLFIAGSFLWALGIVIYTFGYSEVGTVYGFSFGFAIAAAAISMLVGLLMICAARQN